MNRIGYCCINLSINDNKKIAMLKAQKMLKKIGLSNRSDHFPPRHLLRRDS